MPSLIGHLASVDVKQHESSDVCVGEEGMGGGGGLLAGGGGRNTILC